MSKKIIQINEFANQCGCFYNACIEDDINVNNGYNCKHKDQEEFETIDGKQIGKCFSWSCPLAYEADEEDFANLGYDVDDYEEGEFVVVEELLEKESQ